MKEKVSPAKSGIQLGVLFGVIMILEFVIMYIIGMESLIDSPVGLTVNLLNFIGFPFLFIILACNNYKKNLNNGFVSFSECLKIGVTLMFIAGLIYAIFNIIFNLIFPEFIEEMMSILKSQTIKKSPELTPEQLEMALSMQRKFLSPGISGAFTVAMYSFFGLIYSLIIGAIVKKDQPQSF